MGDGATRTVKQVLRHDLRTPLTVVLGRCELMESEALGPLTEEQRRSLGAIARNALRLQRELEHLAEHLPAAALLLDIPAPGAAE